MRPLDPALGLRGVGAEDIDVELMKGAAELGHATLGLLWLVGAEDRVLVAVERDGLAVILQVGPRGLEIGKGALAGDEAQVHQATGGIVHEHQQGALRAATLKPPVLAAVHLDQLAETIAPVTGLVDALVTITPTNPDAVVDHPLAQRLDADRQAVDLGQLLSRKRWTEILVALANDGQAGLTEDHAMGPVAGLATALGDQGVWASGAKGVQQPVDLPTLQTHQRRGVLDARPAVGQIDHNPKPAELCAAHRNHRHPPSPSTPKPKGTTVSSQSVRPVTSLSVIYIQKAHNKHYRK